MITLICTKCKSSLEMDEAFAGGVCRCQYCGTIQTVPSHLKQTTRGAAAVGAAPKALYSTKSASGAGLPSSGLDELANVVASSGLASGLANRTATRPDYATPATERNPTRLPLIIGVGGVVAALLGVIIFLLISRTPSAPPAAPQQTNGPTAAETPNQRRQGTPAVTGPHFLDIPIQSNKVVYLLDRGQSGRDILDPLKAALMESLRSLGADREFQVLFWTPPSSPTEKPDVDEFAYPKKGMAKANNDRIEECDKRFEDLTTSGRTDVGPVITEAMKRNPQVIFIATAKGINIDDTMIAQVNKARGNKPVIIHTIDITSAGEAKDVLQRIAQSTGGTYLHVQPQALHGR